jgi:hypothetical protein
MSDQNRNSGFVFAGFFLDFMERERKRAMAEAARELYTCLAEKMLISKFFLNCCTI